MRWVVGGPGFVRAYQSVLRNKGSSGVDGVKTEDLPRYLMYYWEDIKDELKQGKYEPQLVRGVKIPKPSGGVRQLGIPTVMDRIIQGAIHETLSPIWEPHFSDHSYGFRPKRNADQALFQAQEYINEGRQWIIDLDLKKFFDRVQHDYLMSRVCQRVKDKTLLQLIGKYLRSGIMEEEVVQERLEGAPQGGPLSPLLSNILLHELDRELESIETYYNNYIPDSVQAPQYSKEHFIEASFSPPFRKPEFTAEEHDGRAIDSQILFQKYLNMTPLKEKGILFKDNLQFVRNFERIFDVGLDIKMKHFQKFYNFYSFIDEYLVKFFKKVQPLVNFESVQNQISSDFEKKKEQTN